MGLNKFIKIAFTTLAFCIYMLSYAGNEINISGEVDDDGKEMLQDVKVSVYSNGKLIQSVKTNGEGKYELEALGFGAIYQIHFSIKGYSYKFAEIDLTISPDDGYEGIFPMNISVSLFKTNFFNARKFKFLKTEAAAKASYKKSIDNIEWDIKYIQEMSSRIKKKRKLE